MSPEPNLRFEGQTYVAFCDLCGFKELMKIREQAYTALNHLFQSVYNLLDINSRSLMALVVSDCVIAWATDRELQTIVDFVSSLHRTMIENGYLMRTSIAHGNYEYENRIQLSNLQKAMLMGGAYLDAYLNNKKARPGSILLLTTYNNDPTEYPVLYQNWKWTKRKHGWEYFWPSNRQDDIERFKGVRANKNNNYESLKDLLYEVVTSNQRY